MRIDGRRMYLDNFKSEDLHRVHAWSQDMELVELECDNIEAIKRNADIADYEKNCMPKFIGMNHEADASMCYFGIYRKHNDELIGNVVFMYTDENDAELTVSICEKEHRNKYYGVDALMVALKYAFEIKGIRHIIVMTRMTNEPVKNICGKKFGLDYETEHYKDDYYDVDLVRYVFTKDTYEKAIQEET